MDIQEPHKASQPPEQHTEPGEGGAQFLAGIFLTLLPIGLSMSGVIMSKWLGAGFLVSATICLLWSINDHATAKKWKPRIKHRWMLVAFVTMTVISAWALFPERQSKIKLGFITSSVVEATDGKNKFQGLTVWMEVRNEGPKPANVAIHNIWLEKDGITYLGKLPPPGVSQRFVDNKQSVTLESDDNLYHKLAQPVEEGSPVSGYLIAVFEKAKNNEDFVNLVRGATLKISYRDGLGKGATFFARPLSLGEPGSFTLPAIPGVKYHPPDLPSQSR